VKTNKVVAGYGDLHRQGCGGVKDLGMTQAGRLKSRINMKISTTVVIEKL